MSAPVRLPISGRHADPTVQPHALSVQIRCRDHELGQCGVLVRLAQPLGEWHDAASALFTCWVKGQQWRVEDAGRIVLTRMPSPIRSRAIGSVMPTMPAFEAEYDAWPIWPSCAATDAVLTIAPRSPSSRTGSVISRPPIRRATECPYEVDLDDAVEVGGRERHDRAGALVAARGFDSLPVPAQLTRTTLLADGGARFCEAGVHLLFAGDVHLAEHATQFSGQRFARGFVQVEQCDPDAMSGEAARGGRARPEAPP